ncbi:TPA: 4-hydroxythreonine-4-phosphate dehydrogenase PdxA [Neisseria weaveri]
MKQAVLAVTSGEPAGIGPDICLDLALTDLPCRCVVLGDKALFKQRAEQLGKPVRIREYADQAPEQGCLDVVHIPLAEACEAGRLNVNNAAYVLKLLDTAYDGIQSGRFSGMVTAPLHKGIINDMGLAFSGHTEYLAEKSRTPQVVMMLAGGGMRVALATTHLPLRDVADTITVPLLCSVTEILYRDLQTKFGIAAPRILVAGLNPHAGEGGHLGREEIEVVIPALDLLREKGWDIRGPYPADTLFQPFMLEGADAVLAMYHDQGLPVLKYAGFGEGVNITLGLPFVRTSVDHGTALDLAGGGNADSGSLIAAVEAAYQMAVGGNK